ncbi:MAG: serine/threonine protein kinase, partial [Muribaculaceae bacterium]|nr:serine/threonine protein kinase [Muribaculaceae bacterium]
MNEIYSSESGFVHDPDNEFEVMTGMTDVEILHISKVNIIARGRRYGRLWLLKGLRPELRSSNVNRRRLQKEFEIHSRLLNSSVAQVAGFETIGDLGQCIVEEWVEGKTLAQLLQHGTLSKTERHAIMRDIIRAVGYIHSRGVVHRDLKPDNIMIRDAGGGTVIIDFGLADTDDYAELKQAAGSPGYISPEQESAGAAKTSDDIYSLGVIMKQLCPDYRRIADRCTGPADKRPKDADALLKLLDRHDRRPKIILTAACSVALVAAAAALASHYLTLSQTTKQAQHQVATLTETNRLHAGRVAMLTDSLTTVTDRMNKAESEIQRVESYNESRAKAYIEGCQKIERTLKNFDTAI